LSAALRASILKPIMNLVRISILVLAAWFAAGTPASAQTRWVVVNGQRLGGAEIAQLERSACTPIPNGNYWLNLQTGAWGYAGNPRVQGVFGDACGRQQPRRSLSERGLLYRPGELLSQ
jgi:hypothetical protein